MQISARTIQYHNCPACGHTALDKKFDVKDYSISQQVFPILLCRNCSLCFTQDAPDAHSIGPFYEAPHYVSHSDTNEGLVNKLYQAVKKFTIKGKVRLLNTWSYHKKGSLLDIGCGTGSFLAAVKADGWKISGLEPDENARKLATEKTGEQIFSPETIYSLPDHSFDAITLWHVLEHVHDLQGYVNALRRILKPGGILVIAVPNYTSFDAEYYSRYWAAWDVPRHLYHFSPESVKKLFGDAGFSLKTLQPMWFDSFYVSMLSEKYRKGSVVKAFFVGAWSNWKALLHKEKCSSVMYVFNNS